MSTAAPTVATGRKAISSAFSMWSNTRMIVLVALTAAIYAGALAAFKTAIPLIPGFTEVRIGNIFPIAFGLLFGPAGAWGAAFGNLIGDFFGTLGPGSIFGFVGNFFLGFVPWVVWNRLQPLSAGSEEPTLRSARQWVEFLVVALATSAAGAVIIAWGVNYLGFVPFAVLGNIITINNFFASIIGGILLALVYSRVKQMGLLWNEVLDPEEIPARSTTWAWVLVAAALVGWIVGAFLLPASLITPVIGLFVLVILIAAVLI